MAIIQLRRGAPPSNSYPTPRSGRFSGWIRTFAPVPIEPGMTDPVAIETDRPWGDVALRRTVAWVAAAAGTAAVFSYFLLPSTTAQDIAYAALGFVSTIAMAIGIRI